MREIKHLSIQQWLRSAIPDSQQPTSPIGFLFSKIPPPPCAVLLVYICIFIYVYIYRISQDLHTRPAYEHPRKTFIQTPKQSIFKILMQGPLEEDFNRISTRPSHKDLYGLVKDIDEDLHLLLLEPILQNLDTRSSQRAPTRAFIQAPL